MLNWDVLHGSPEWHALRVRHIGSSESSALFGVQPDYAMSLFTLHQVKAGIIPPPPVDDRPGSRVWMGRLFEPAIARGAAEMFGWEVRYPGPYAIHDKIKGMAASLDGVIAEPGEEETRLGFRGEGLLECKRTEWLAYKQNWINNEPPFQAILQAQHGLACTGYRWGVVVALVGELGLIAYRYRARPNIISMIEERVQDFWARVRRGDPPDTDASHSTADALKTMFPERVDEPILDLLGNKAADLTAHEIMLTRENLKASQAAYQSARNAMAWILKEHTRAESDSYWINVQANNVLKIAPKPESAKPKPKKRK